MLVVVRAASVRATDRLPAFSASSYRDHLDTTLSPRSLTPSERGCACTLDGIANDMPFIFWSIKLES